MIRRILRLASADRGDRTWSVRRGIAHDPQCVYTRQIRPRNRRDGADWREHCWRGCLRCKPDQD